MSFLSNTSGSNLGGRSGLIGNRFDPAITKPFSVDLVALKWVDALLVAIHEPPFEAITTFGIVSWKR